MASAQSARPNPISIRSLPQRPIVEVDGSRHFLNFEMEVSDSGSEAVRLSQIELSVYDSAHSLLLRKSLNSDAFAPSIAIIGTQHLEPGETLDVFNPFYEFDRSLALVDLEFSFCIQRERSETEREANSHRLPGDCDYRQTLTVQPRDYEDKTRLALPLRGKVFVWEGHDFYAHHFRVPLSAPKVQALGITANSNDFADDFIYLDAQGRQYRDDARKLENWFSYGQPIYAPRAGKVLAAANDIPENWFEDAAASRIGYPKLPTGKDPNDTGNFVLIDHQDGEYSLLIHMKPGSVTVKAGDLVKSGQFIGRIGFSGDSIFPHLHYALMDGPEIFKAWGLPAYFLHFHRIWGTQVVKVEKGPVNSGDFVESDLPETKTK